MFFPGDPLRFLDRFIQHLAVQIVTDRFHMPVLLGSEQISRATDLQIPHRDLKPASEFRKFLDRRKTLFRDLL